MSKEGPTEKSSLVKSGRLELSGHSVMSAGYHGRYGESCNNNNNNNSAHSDQTPSTRDGVDAEGDGDGEDEVSSRCGLCRHFSGRRKYTLAVVAVATVVAGMALSMIAPFYPMMAEEKGMDMTMIGLVFGIFEFMIFLTAPIFGNCLVTLGPKFVFLAGAFVGGSCNVLFGVLEYCPGGTPFIVLSLLIRSLGAVGFSACNTAGFAIVSNEFKKNIGLTIGVIRTASGFGLMMGPTIGAALYELNGFSLPLYFVGILGLLNGVAIYKVIPSVVGQQYPAERKGSMFSLARSPMVAVPLCSIFWGMVGLTTYESTFSRHIEPLHLSVGMVGVIFGVMAFVYSAMSSVWGYISDFNGIQAPIIIGGHLVFAIGYLIIGPSFMLPFIPFSLVTISIGLACIGLSLGATFIPTMKCMVIGAIELGFEDNVDTYGLVAGLFTSIQTLGGFIGPVGVGYLVDQFDFPVAYSVVALAHVLMMVLCFVFFALRRIRRRRKAT